MSKFNNEFSPKTQVRCPKCKLRAASIVAHQDGVYTLKCSCCGAGFEKSKRAMQENYWGYFNDKGVFVRPKLPAKIEPEVPVKSITQLALEKAGLVVG